jgi:hypothetical protein
MDVKKGECREYCAELVSVLMPRPPGSDQKEKNLVFIRNAVRYLPLKK